MAQLIEIQKLTKSFNHNLVLDRVSLNVAKGSTVVVMGRSGCGKTVLLKLIIGLLRPDSGSIKFQGREITTMEGRELNEIRKSFGMVFQYSALFDSLSVYDNISFPLKRQTKLSEEEIAEKVREKLNLVELSGAENLMPSELSGGMKKRVSLARALIHDPKIVLYDEPTAGADPVLASEIEKLIKDLDTRLGVTSMVVSHDIVSAFNLADEIAFLDEGKIVKLATPQEFLVSEDPRIRNFIDSRDLKKRLTERGIIL